MGLKSFFQRKDANADTASPARARRNVSASESADAVLQARTRARQRLIGAVVLLGIGIIGFPLLFETQPRPIPVDLPIEIPRKEGMPPLQLPAPRVAAAPAASRPAPAPPASAPLIEERAADAGREVPPPVAVASSSAVPASAARKPAEKPAAEKPAVAKPAADKPAADSAAAKPATSPPAEDAARAQALLEGKDTKSASAAATDAAGRFIVQVGAFAEPTAAREARLKVEKLGLKTYTQVVETDAGKRIRVRVGPFGTRDEADKAASKIKSAGLASAVLTL